jgi:hypothetical protein
MPSPFPGMNPYLEHPHVWHDFHETFCVCCRTALLPALRPKYYCSLDEHVYIHELPEDDRRLVGRGDVVITEVEPSSPAPESVSVQTAASVRGRILPYVDIVSESSLKIRDRDTRELVTSIELLSPSNKMRGEDRNQFIAKRRTLLDTSSHYVEIDLLRGGPRLPVEGLPPCDYYALVSRTETRPDVEIWPLKLRQNLPVVSIPLRAPDQDISLDLYAVLQMAFDAGAYDAVIYKRSPEPPLSTEDQAWADQLINRASMT